MIALRAEFESPKIANLAHVASLESEIQRSVAERIKSRHDHSYSFIVSDQTMGKTSERN